jgi:hypothetical protein
MACFLVPTGEAIVTTVIKHLADKKGVESPFIKRMNWLNNMLWGGSALLAFEHVWHGEVTPWFPFLTNAASPESAAEMFHEMATNGVAMAVLVTLAWIAMVCISISLSKKSITSEKTTAVPGKKEA